MTLFNKTVPVVIPDLTPIIAQSIYESLKITNNKEETIATGLFYPEHVIDTDNEIGALEEIAQAAMMRTERSWQEVSGEDAEMNPIYVDMYTPPAPNSIAELELEVASDILDISVFVEDFMDYILMYKENTTWADFAEQYVYLRQQQNEI